MDRKGINISMNHVKWVLRSQHWGGQGKRYWFRIPPPGGGGWPSGWDDMERQGGSAWCWGPQQELGFYSWGAGKPLEGLSRGVTESS